MLARATQLATQWREAIRSGRWALGDRLPSEREMMAQSGFSRGTVRKALEILEGERLVVRQHGLGTFVADAAHAQLQGDGTTLIGLMAYEREYCFEPVIQAATTQASRLGYAVATGTNSTEKSRAMQHNGLSISVLHSNHC